MFEVVWLQTALDELATVWMRADSASRQAITAAVHAIDLALRTDPLQQGESRDEGERIFHLHPLGLTFKVDAARSRVGILHVWDIRRRR